MVATTREGTALGPLPQRVRVASSRLSSTLRQAVHSTIRYLRSRLDDDNKTRPSDYLRVL